MNDPTANGPADALEAALECFKRDWERGAGPVVDEFCRRHPHIEGRLRRRIEDFLFVADGLGEVDPEPRRATRPPETIGPYRIIDELGSGGMGTVYRAERIAPIRQAVAIKVIRSRYESRQVLARFDVERRVLATMSHTNRVFGESCGCGAPSASDQELTGAPLRSVTIGVGPRRGTRCDRRRW